MLPTTPSSSNMAPGSWRALTASRLASLKDYIAQKDYRTTYDALSSRVRGKTNQEKPTWDEWARQTLGRPYGSSVDLPMSLGVEKVQLFPGWAVRRYADPAQADQEGAKFALDVYISGFASSLLPPEAATRSQKAFYRIAKSYAALPKLPTVATPIGHPPQQFDVSTDLDMSKLPLRPDEKTDESELTALEAHFQQTYHPLSERSSGAESARDEEEIPKDHPTDRSGSYDFPQVPQTHASTPSAQRTPSLFEHITDHAAHKLHANLDARLQPFWSSAISNRLVRLSVFCPRVGHVPFEAEEPVEGREADWEPVATQDVVTNPQGSFQTTLNVPWERLATYPPTLHIAFGEPNIEYPVVIQSEMWPLPSPSLSSTSSDPYSPFQRSSASLSQPHLLPTSKISSSSSSLSQSYVQDSQTPSIKSSVTVPLSVFHVPIRLISDIDDTVKHAGIPLGAKNVFQNVFVRHLDELVIHNMTDWYRMLWQRGVRFHYVSNSPFELLPVLNEFFRVSSLPQGSIKLKSYAARSLLPALLSPPASRKRQGVIEVLNAFPESRFILVGDSGEQDMELYAELARERPTQVSGVFIRDVTTDADQDSFSQEQVDAGALNAQFDPPLVEQDPEQISTPSRDALASIPSVIPATNGDPHTPPPVPREASSSPFFGSSPSRSAFSPRFSRQPRRKSSTNMTLEEKKRFELRARIERARVEIPRHTAFRVFRVPDECVEVEDILTMWLGTGHR